MDNWIDNLRRIGLKRYGDENRRILSELLRNGIPAGNTVMSEASAETLIIAVAAMIEENNKAMLSDLSSMQLSLFLFCIKHLFITFLILIPICEFLGASSDYLLTGKERNSNQSTLSEDSEWLALIHQLPHDAQLEFRGELKGYIKCLKRQEEDTVEPLKKAK